MLSGVFDKMLAESGTLPTLGQQLQHILSSLTASLQAMTVSNKVQASSIRSSVPEPCSTDAEDALVKLILKLTSQAPAQLQEYLRDAEPLLPFPALEAACR